MLKIFHISDLHFCEQELAEKLKSVATQLKDVGIHSLDVHFADKDVLQALGAAISREDPTLVVVSGDITTFGDEKSFNEFIEWSRALSTRPGGEERKWLVVPGNHDALQAHLSQLCNESGTRLPSILKSSVRTLLRGALKPLREYIGNSPRKSKHLSAFQEAVGASHLNGKSMAFPLPDCKGVCVRFIPFSTVSAEPWWMNEGKTSVEDWRRLQADLNNPTQGGVDIRIVVAHHNPIAPASGNETRLSYAYNGMPEGTRFIKELQKADIAFILHGHQHEYCLYSINFDPQRLGLSYVLSADSATMRPDASKSGGFNVLEFMDPNHARVKRFKHSLERGFQSDDSAEATLHLERQCPADSLTQSARCELKQYFTAPGGDADDVVFQHLQKNPSDLVYMSGRHFSTIASQQFGHLNEVLSRPNGRVRMLLIDPTLIEGLGDLTIKSGVRRTVYWGSKEGLSDLAKKAQDSLDALKRYVARHEDKASRIDVRIAQTLLPYGAYVRDSGTKWGKMAIKPLPIGAIGAIPAPVLRLSQRTEETMYDYYLKHLKYLFLISTRVCGDWVDEADLFDGLGPDLECDIRELRERRQFDHDK